MKIILQPTTKLVIVKNDALGDGICCRVWEGTLENGDKCFAFINRVSLSADSTTESKKELFTHLLQCNAPSAEVAQLATTLIL
ncbi:MAG: hypothetical protein ACK5JD_06205 [Mangrovibacterium sp.]